MKKETLLKIVFVLLPVLAVSLAMSGNSVMFYDPAVGEAAYYSYFDLNATGPMPLAAPMAGICAIICGTSAIIYFAAGKLGALSVVKWAAFFGACVAVLPVIAREDVKLVPSVGVPLLLMAEMGLSAMLMKEKKADKTLNPRLNER